jgi:hypothetical protein
MLINAAARLSDTRACCPVAKEDHDCTRNIPRDVRHDSHDFVASLYRAPQWRHVTGRRGTSPGALHLSAGQFEARKC